MHMCLQGIIRRRIGRSTPPPQQPPWLGGGPLLVEVVGLVNSLESVLATFPVALVLGVTPGIPFLKLVFKHK